MRLLAGKPVSRDWRAAAIAIQAVSGQVADLHGQTSRRGGHPVAAKLARIGKLYDDVTHR